MGCHLWPLFISVIALPDVTFHRVFVGAFFLWLKVENIAFVALPNIPLFLFPCLYIWLIISFILGQLSKLHLLYDLFYYLIRKLVLKLFIWILNWIVLWKHRFLRLFFVGLIKLRSLLLFETVKVDNCWIIWYVCQFFDLLCSKWHISFWTWFNFYWQ